MEGFPAIGRERISYLALATPDPAKRTPVSALRPGAGGFHGISKQARHAGWIAAVQAEQMSPLMLTTKGEPSGGEDPPTSRWPVPGKSCRKAVAGLS